MSTEQLLSKKEIISRKRKFIWERVTGIYFLILNDEIIYIGTSEDCQVRIMTHAKYKKFNSYYIIDTGNMGNGGRHALESWYIDKYKPKYNKERRKIKAHFTEKVMKKLRKDSLQKI